MAFEGLSEKLNSVFKGLRGKGRLTEEDIKLAMREVRMALLEADVSYKVVKDFVARVSERAVGAEVLDSLTPAQQVIKIVNEELTALMGGANARLTFANNPPTVVMMVGLQGAGKTTNVAKLAGLLRRQGKRPLLAACDVYRPAAITQLQVVGAQLGLPVFEMGQIDPVTIAVEAVKYAKDHGNDIVFLDTAGRLHIDEQLMDELKRVKAAVKPNEILLVVDAMTGQDAVNAATAFDEALGIDGVVLTKLDGDARGGAALSIRAATGKPIKYIGTGEKLDMLEPFHPDRMASRILGMGDVLSLIEKAEQTLDEKKAAEMAANKQLKSGTIQDVFDRVSVGTFLGLMKGISLNDILGSGADEINSVLSTVNNNANLINKVLGKLTVKVNETNFFTTEHGTFTPGTSGDAYHNFMEGVIGMTSEGIKAMTPAQFKCTEGSMGGTYYAVPVTVEIDLESSMGFAATETVVVVMHIDFSQYTPSATVES